MNDGFMHPAYPGAGAVLVLPGVARLRADRARLRRRRGDSQDAAGIQGRADDGAGVSESAEHRPQGVRQEVRRLSQDAVRAACCRRSRRSRRRSTRRCRSDAARAHGGERRRTISACSCSPARRCSAHNQVDEAIPLLERARAIFPGVRRRRQPVRAARDCCTRRRATSRKQAEVLDEVDVAHARRTRRR